MSSKKMAGEKMAGEATSETASETASKTASETASEAIGETSGGKSRETANEMIGEKSGGADRMAAAARWTVPLYKFSPALRPRLSLLGLPEKFTFLQFEDALKKLFLLMQSVGSALPRLPSGRFLPNKPEPAEEAKYLGRYAECEYMYNLMFCVCNGAVVIAPEKEGGRYEVFDRMFRELYSREDIVGCQ